MQYNIKYCAFSREFCVYLGNILIKFSIYSIKCSRLTIKENRSYERNSSLSWEYIKCRLANYIAEYISIYRSTCTNTSTNREVCSNTWFLFLFLDGALGDALCGDLVNIQDCFPFTQLYKRHD